MRTLDQIQNSIEKYRDAEVRKAIRSTSIQFYPQVQRGKIKLHLYLDNDDERVYPQKGQTVALDDFFDQHWLKYIESSYDEIETALNAMERLVARLRREVEKERQQSAEDPRDYTSGA